MAQGRAFVSQVCLAIGRRSGLAFESAGQSGGGSRKTAGIAHAQLLVVMRMFPSHVRLGTETRHEMCQLLNTSLAATLDLTYQVKQAHWNIKGPQFFARHELFDKLADRVRGFSDDIAERVSTLGGYARGTVRMSAEGSPLAEYDSDAVQGKAHIRTLVDRYGHLCGLLREQIGTVQKLDDVATEDLLTEVVRELELDMWFLESHLNVEPEN